MKLLPLPGRKVTVYIPILSFCIIICLLIYFFASMALSAIVASSAEGMAVQGAKLVQSELQKRMDLVKIMANHNMTEKQNLSDRERLSMIVSGFDTSSFDDLGISDLKGYTITQSGISFYSGDRSYYIDAISGKDSISYPVTSRVNGQLVIIFAVPIDQNGKVTGAFSATYPVEDLCSITDGINITKDGFAYIVDSAGRIVAHKNRALIADEEAYQQSQADPGNKSLNDANAAMRSGKTGAIQYTYNGATKYMGYAPIEGTTWFIGVTAPKAQVFAGINRILVFILICVILFSLVIVLLNTYSRKLGKKLRVQERFSQTAIDTGGIITLQIDNEGNVLGFNKYLEMKTGISKTDLQRNISLPDLVSDEDKDRANVMLQEILGGTGQGNIELAFKGHDKQSIFIIWNIAAVDIDSKVSSIELMGLDITEIMKAKIELQLKNDELSTLYEQLSSLYEELSASEEELKTQYLKVLENEESLRKSEDRYSLVTNASNIGIWERDLISGQQYFSPRWYEIHGFDGSEPEIEINNWASQTHPDDLDEWVKKVNEHLSNRSAYFEHDYRIRRKNGSVSWVHSVGKGVWNEEGTPIKIAGAISEITIKKEYEEKIKKFAYYDVLTDLPNRAMFIEKFNELSLKNNEIIALIFMDVDNFKLINDSYGHNVGDCILVETGKRIAAVKKENTMLFRIGGDEFAILAWGDMTDEDIEAYIKDFVIEIDKNYSIQEYIFNITVSIGLAIYPRDAQSFMDLLKNSDTAMYKAKESGKNRYVFFNNEMKDEIMKKMQISSQLHNALVNNEFDLFYQPIYRASDAKIEGFEALLRWNSPVIGEVPPMEFIGIAEENRIIIPLGEWVLRKACSFLKEINTAGNGSFFMAVNISVLQIIRSDFSDLVIKILKEYELPPELLELEITESVFIESFDNIVKNIMALRKSGVKIALDDFGKGYSSLSYLKRLPITTLKIDKSFIDNITTSDEKNILADTIIMIGKTMGLTVVAEGVETLEQYDYLIRYHCDRIQGYYFSKPLPESSIWELVGK